MSHIADFFKFDPTPGQRRAMTDLERFLDGRTRGAFILKGFAGTGKTTVLQAVGSRLKAEGRAFSFLASTGRAARIMEQKTGFPAGTVHSAIYQLDQSRIDPEQTRHRLVFRLRQNFDPDDMVYFIDESSMIADREETNAALLFEDGRLLSHVFRFAENRQVIFIGDHAQLPPVNCSFSGALDEDYLRKTYGLEVNTATLTEVTRQREGSGILNTSVELRHALFQTVIPETILRTPNSSGIRHQNSIFQMIPQYQFDYRTHPTGYATLISVTNGGVHFLNTRVRTLLFGHDQAPLQEGDLLMVYQNNYLWKFYNGQHLVVKSIIGWESDTTPVQFMDIVVEEPENGAQKRIKIIRDLLYRKEPSLTITEENELMKNFAIRMHHENIQKNSEKYVERFMNDPWVNALRVKFGYAVTCHKAQGGEWDKVYLNLEPVLDNMNREQQHRWLYTAITRASRELILPRHPMIRHS